MGDYKQSPAHAGNKAARQALRAQLKEGAELLERRDSKGWRSLDRREQNLLRDYESKTLQRRLQELSQGCEPIPAFFRLRDIPSL